jgi:tetratricopeptide (TPR) repeat protein
MIAHRTVRFPLGAAVALGALIAAAPAFGQAGGARPSPPALKATTASPAIPPRAEAYYQFMLGRQLEGDGDIDGAVKAYREASKLDPKSAEIVAELAGLYARENRGREALDTAQAALAIDADNISAHRVLGIVYASLAGIDQGSGPLDAQSAAYASRAAEHLEAARKARELPEPGLDLMLARIDIRLGERDKAIAVLASMVIENPGQPEPVRMLLQLYQQAGRNADAIALLESVVADQPSFYGPLGELYEQQQRWKEAAGAYEQAIAQNAGGPDLRMKLAVAWLRSGDPAKTDRALDMLEAVRKENPADPNVLFTLSNEQRNAGRLDDAEATARALLAVSPRSVAGAYALALVFDAKQQYRKIIDTLSPIVEERAAGPDGLPSAFSPLLIQLGFASLQLGEPAKALDYYDRAGKLSPPYPGLDVYVVQALLAARRYDDAAALAAKLRASRPDDPRVLQLSAESLRRTGKPDEAVALLTRAIDERPDDLPVWLYAADFDAELGRYDAALDVLDRAESKFPSNVDVTFQIGTVFARQKRYADAERKFREVLARNPRHVAALNYLGYMLADRGERLDESIGYIKRALEISPYDGAILDSLGWAYFRQNKLDLAEVNLVKAAGQRPNDSAIQDHFGDLLFKLGRYPEAATAWQRALDGNMEQVDRAAIEKKLRSAQDKTRKH